MDGTCAVFSRYMRHHRAAAGLSLRDLAEKTGVVSSTLQRTEAGRMVTLPNAVRIAGALGVPLASMLVPPACDSCLGAPPPGFTCNACGTASRGEAA